MAGSPLTTPLRPLRRISLVALILAFAQIVFGAIVRITGSGMGCGDHWPKCNGAWFPPHDRFDLIIEISHRYLALALSLVILWLLIASWRARRSPGVSGPGGVFGPAVGASVLVVIAALLGAVTVKMELNPLVIASHLTIAMSLLAVLAVATFRAGGLGASAITGGGSPRAWGSARVAVILTLLTLALGALTANLPDAASSCGGFPWCRTVKAAGLPFNVHILHRILAFALLGHMIGAFFSSRKRRDPAPVGNAARLAFGAVVVQVLVAGALIEMHFPASLRSLHQAVGTFVWLAVVIFAIRAYYSYRRQAEPVVTKAAA